MNPMIVRSRVDADGVLRVAVPVGPAEADREMQVTIEALPQDRTERGGISGVARKVGRAVAGRF